MARYQAHRSSLPRHPSPQGRLPSEVLEVPPAQRADLLFTNARQLLCQYETRRQQRRAATAAPLYWEHGRLAPHAQKQMVDKVLDYMQKRDWDNAVSFFFLM